MEGREVYSPLYPNDKTNPFPFALAVEPRGEGVVVVGLSLVMAYWGRSEDDRQCVWG